MTLKFQVVLIICVIIFFLLIISLLKKNQLELKYSILWIVTGVVLLVIAVFPVIIGKITQWVGIYSVVNGIFAIALFFILLMLLSMTSIVSKLSKQNKNLAQAIALMEERIQRVEKDKDD